MADKNGIYHCRWNKTEGCTFTTPVKSEVLEHARLKHGYDPLYACDKCGKKFTRDAKLRQHLLEKHKERRKPGPYSGLYTCRDCGQQYDRMKKLHAHKKQVHKIRQDDDERVVVIE